MKTVNVRALRALWIFSSNLRCTDFVEFESGYTIESGYMISNVYTIEK